MKIDWSTYDDLFKTELPNMTLNEFIAKFLPGKSYLATYNRARRLKITYKKEASEEARRKLSKSKKPTQEQVAFIKSNLNVISRSKIVKILGVSFDWLNKTIADLGLVVDIDKVKRFHADGSRTHVDAARAASIIKMTSDDFKRQNFDRKSSIARKMWQNEEYRLKVRNGIRKTYDETDLRSRLSKMSKERYDNDERVRDILLAPRPWKNSKLNDLVALKLEAFGFKFERETSIGFHLFDFKIGNILLEVNSWWHNSPRAKANDRSKRTIIDEYYKQFTVKTIMEEEIRSIRGNELLLERIGTKKITPIEIKLDALSISDDPPDVDKFLNCFHYLGTTGRKKHCFGALLHGEPIAVAVFGQPVRQNVAPGRTTELIRLCRHPKFHNENMLSWFISRCVKSIKAMNKYDSIASFADLRLHVGGIYRACGWTDAGETKSDYCYMSPANIPMHKKTLYNRAVAGGMIESEYAARHGFVKTDVGTKRKFIKRLARRQSS